MKKSLVLLGAAILMAASAFTVIPPSPTIDKKIPTEVTQDIVGQQEVLNIDIGNFKAGTMVTIVSDSYFKNYIEVSRTWPDCGYDHGVCYCCYFSGGGVTCKKSDGKSDCK